LKKISDETIKEVERIYGKATKAEIEQAEILMNNPDILASYYEDND
jgi:hypothetical protein